MRLKSIVESMYKNNDGKRTLLESIVAPEITQAMKTWIGSTAIPGVLIGGLALSFYVKPRYTMDIDVLYATDQEIPDNIPGFKKIRSHSFQHKETHVEVEVLSAEFLNLPIGLVRQVINNAVESNGIKIASKSGLVAMKLCRGNRQDQADIEQLIQSGDVNLDDYRQWLTSDQIQMYKQIKYSLT